MISGIETTFNPYMNGISQQMEAVRAKQMENVERVSAPQESNAPFEIQHGVTDAPESNKVTFGSLIGDLVQEVDTRGKTSADELKKVMTGEVDNLHQSMIAMQEASMAFNVMVEVRNKLMESYQQVMRMQV